ncbi:hypothetical protein BGL34_03950 [Fructilactobacillus lindneri]|uniref:Uncharacterized protein n=2 Tax=Fructilactobacillus lindneri TaxID=53444 RepID=A0A0R2JNU6_9LACO|nr:type II toxin-antitoxin system YafQ family toxin [Fructilactobacillus lindneri]ANZ57727.1 hypothetical protein AYR60_02590 [Fructilactobacillus lindneri]ANZ58997.1 hypothetical protein AYR59_02590 [Fructilactobacillus lindneri]KRN78835.1 hypothetical protein IV52_GL001115 [Fructilactobacillus lindneri DSM 20690 = JCM 11027]POG98022.1 hypothetical protein BGL31_04805 [Fructilactobacillus lindneri]POG99080.1 hypothetical protein BGL32_05980 [Fructilactobacillus lindneri]
MKVKVTKQFERDLKKIKRKHFDMEKFQIAITAITKQDNNKLKQLKAHKLSGNLKEYYELHIQSDWLLLYKVENHNLILILTRIEVQNGFC